MNIGENRSDIASVRHPGTVGRIMRSLPRVKRPTGWFMRRNKTCFG